MDSEANTRHQVAVILLTCYRMEFFISPDRTDGYGYRDLGSKSRVISWIDRLSGQLKQISKDISALQGLDQICKMVIGRTKAFSTRSTSADEWVRERAPFSNEAIFHLIKTSVDLDMKDMFFAVYEICPEDLTPVISKIVGSDLLRYDLGVLLDK
jgi:hypothetical protein